MSLNEPNLELILVCLAKAVRTFGFGAVSVILAMFLAKNHFSSFEVGAIFSATLIEDAIFTTIVSLFATRLGMRKVLLYSGLLMVVAGICMVTATQPWLIALAAVCGVFSPAGWEGGPFSAVEQAIIARDVRADKLTAAFSWYNLTGFAGAAAGSLLAGICFAAFKTINVDFAYQVIFLAFIASGVVMTIAYATLPLHFSRKETAHCQEIKSEKLDFRSVLTKRNAGMLVMLQGLDAFGGGFVVQSLIAYWFYIRYHAGAEFTGYIFCVANVLAAISFLAAPMVAKRIGLLKTMVFTHLPCSVALCFVPFMPTAQLAALLMLSRSLFSSMDIPARQAYSMLLVDPDDRAAVAGLTTASRAIAQGCAPLVSGWATLNAVSGAPFIVAGLCKTAYDVCLYLTFRKIPVEGTEAATVTEQLTDAPTPLPSNSARQAAASSNS